MELRNVVLVFESVFFDSAIIALDEVFYKIFYTHHEQKLLDRQALPLPSVSAVEHCTRHLWVDLSIL